MAVANILEKVIESVDEALKHVGLPITPHNRLEVLNGMYKTATMEGVKPDERYIVQAIEDEIIRLSELDV